MYDLTRILKNEKLDDGYYHIFNDLIKYPDAVIIVCWSKRGPGKTYSTLWSSYSYPVPMIYMKRTNDDVEFICNEQMDLSPYKSVNRDKHINVKPQLIDKGMGAFYNMVENDEGKEVPSGPPVSLLLSLNKIKAIKGMDLSDYDWLVLDEFIPQPGEIVKYKEGEMLLSLYMTVARDRQKRGREPLKLILFANAEEISTPITNTLEIVDDMVELMASGESHLYLSKRKILLHHITEEEIPMTEQEKVGIYEAMEGTAWARKTFEGEFSGNDFSCVQKRSLKGYHIFCKLKYKDKFNYIYEKENNYYMCSSKAKCDFMYDLDRESEQKLFMRVTLPILKDALITGHMYFEKYSQYDLISNYVKIFRL
ncbi:MAG: hypothetical protein J6S67_07950 [Methanobrevibacter sp.]|nr:hypothetical protein [Methanobrevibacter sp.]